MQLDLPTAAMDLLTLLTLIPVLVLAFLLPSKDRILRDGILVPKNMRMFQLIVGMGALVVALVLGGFVLLLIMGNMPSIDEVSKGNTTTIRTMMMSLNSLALLVVGGLHIMDHVRTGKVQKNIAIAPQPVEEEAIEEEVAVIPSRTSRSRPAPEVLTIQCPDCGNTLKITVKKRPAKVKCPVCGLIGEV